MLSTCQHGCGAWEAKEGLRIDATVDTSWSIVGSCKTDKADGDHVQHELHGARAVCAQHVHRMECRHLRQGTPLERDTAHDCKRRADQGDCKTDAQANVGVSGTCAGATWTRSSRCSGRRCGRSSRRTMTCRSPTAPTALLARAGPARTTTSSCYRRSARARQPPTRGSRGGGSRRWAPRPRGAPARRPRGR